MKTTTEDKKATSTNVDANQNSDKAPDKKPDESAVALFTNRLISKPETGTKAEDDEEKPKSPDDKKAEDKKDDADTKKKPEKKSVKQKQSVERALDRDDIAGAVAEGVARGMKKTDDEPADEVKKNDVDAEMPPAEKRRIAALGVMEKSNPDKYKGIVQKYRNSLSKLVTYAEQWEKDNPGKTFNESETDEDGKEIHAKFFKDNEVDWDDEDFTDALADLKADEKVASKMSKYDEKFAAQERKDKLVELAPKIESAKVEEARAYFSEVDADFANILKENGSVDHEALKKLRETDPVKTAIVTAGADNLEAYTGEVTKLFSVDKSYDPENPIHTDINRFILRKEAQELALPREQQIDDKGRLFCAAKEYHALPEKEKSKRWTFEQSDIRGLLRAAIIKRTKAQIELEEKKFAEMAKARGMAIPDKKVAAAPVKKEEAPKKKVTEADEEDADLNGDKPDSPSASSQTRVNGSGDKGDEGKEGVSKFRSKYLSAKN